MQSVLGSIPVTCYVVIDWRRTLFVGTALGGLFSFFFDLLFLRFFFDGDGCASGASTGSIFNGTRCIFLGDMLAVDWVLERRGVGDDGGSMAVEMDAIGCRVLLHNGIVEAFRRVSMGLVHRDEERLFPS